MRIDARWASRRSSTSLALALRSDGRFVLAFVDVDDLKFDQRLSSSLPGAHTSARRSTGSASSLATFEEESIPISVRLAAFEVGDSLELLIKRADSALLAPKRRVG